MKIHCTVSGPIGVRRSGIEVPLTLSTDLWVKFAAVSIPWAALVDPDIVEGVNAEVALALQRTWRRAERGAQLPLEIWE